MYGMVGGRKKSNVPKQKVTLRQTLCEPLRVTDDSQQRELGERQSQDGGFHRSRFHRPLLVKAGGRVRGAVPREEEEFFLKKVISILRFYWLLHRPALHTPALWQPGFAGAQQGFAAAWLRRFSAGRELREPGARCPPSCGGGIWGDLGSSDTVASTQRLLRPFSPREERARHFYFG